MTEPKATSPVLFRIQAGKCIGDICLGDSIENIQNYMKCEGTRSDYQAEYDTFNNYGYPPMEYLQFHIGFDYVQIFDEGDSPAYPIFKLYFKNDALVFMIITSYGTDIFNMEVCQRILTEKNVSFGTPLITLTQIYGEHYAKHLYGTYDGDFIYPELGISFIADEGKVRVIRLFQAMNETEAATIKAKYVS